MDVAGIESLACPHCDALNRASAQWCACCRRPFMPANKTVAMAPEVGGRWTMRLRTVMLLSALVAVGLAVSRVSIDPRALIVALISLALLRTASAAVRRRAENRPMTGAELVGSFCRSIGLFVVIGTATGGVFLISCVTGLLGGVFVVSMLAEGSHSLPLGFSYGIEVGFWVGIVAALSILVILTRQLWRTWD